MRIVIAGASTTGSYLAKLLQLEKHDLVIIDNDKKRIQSLQEQFDAQIVMGDAADATVIEPLIDENVDLFISLTSSDSINIISTLIARKFGAKRAIVRINETNNLLHPLLTDDANVFLLNPEMIVSKDLSRLVGTPSADEVDFFAKGKAEMVTLHLTKDSPLSGKPIKDIKFPSSWLVVAAIRRGNFVIASGDTVLSADDQVLVVGDPNKYPEIATLFGHKFKKVSRVVLVGFNETSIKLSQSLVRKEIEVRLIENNSELALVAAGELDSVLVLQGDVTDDDILEQAGVADADYLIALTDDDEENVLISLLAKEKGVAKVIALIQKNHYRSVIQKIGIDTVINPRSAMVDEVIRLIHRKDLLEISILEGGQGRMMEFVVNQKTRLVDKPLSKVKLPKQILIGAIVRGDDLIIPKGDTKLKVGDHVVIFSTMSVFTEVKKLFGN